MPKIEVVLGKPEPQYYSGGTFNWPPGIYVPVEGERGAFAAIVVKEKSAATPRTVYAVCDRFISPNQGYVGNRYWRAPQGTIVKISDDVRWDVL